MKEKFTGLFLLFFTVIGYAQQDSQYTQYMYNTININPAYAGSREAMSIFVLHRAQWVGLDGAPVTNTVSLHTPINNSDVGLGISIVNDKIGPSDESTISADFSYTIPTSETFKLSFGLKASASLLNIDFINKLSKYDLNDYQFETNIDNKFSPNIGAGVYLHSESSYIGLSVPNFLETKHFDRYASRGANSHVAAEKMHYYLIAGHVFDLSSEVKFKPSVLTKLVQGAPLQVDLSGNFLINDKVMAGVAYRWSAALSAMVGFQVNDSWFIGYSYDLETTRLENYNSGSHEIFLRYELFNRYDKMVSPRFF
ncbi:PorP/SprF family type IX secretion system membrane protein [Flavobacterium granuli]|uniref:Type IX secretion system PorP/SprF family membrane protein n=1 Tax=Flavobacterium granuli TaxID=280093 RepID=A0A1M5UCP1_9FLAO|nr:type IX secretion system membrane protein PorP/SprF [Flavobacterium granuli]PRZ19240.1 type IX secretion system PorP/SprF family membrane protein [Flavobacterium granuli]SHH60727.1 type IX secretion system membrane protein, PorP/SprF family [Flavobacterium granuli]